MPINTSMVRRIQNTEYILLNNRVCVTQPNSVGRNQGSQGSSPPVPAIHDRGGRGGDGGAGVRGVAVPAVRGPRRSQGPRAQG